MRSLVVRKVLRRVVSRAVRWVMGCACGDESRWCGVERNVLRRAVWCDEAFLAFHVCGDEKGAQNVVRRVMRKMICYEAFFVSVVINKMMRKVVWYTCDEEKRDEKRNVV